jgi:hypothetical protein
LTEVAAAGDRAKSLAALRDFLASELVKCDGRGAAALAHEFRETLRELSAVEMPEGDAVDELAAERAKRRAGASA